MKHVGQTIFYRNQFKWWTTLIDLESKTANWMTWKFLCFICYIKDRLCLFVKREISTNVFCKESVGTFVMYYECIVHTSKTYCCLLQERVGLFILTKWITFVLRRFVSLKSNIWAYCKYDNVYQVNEASDAKGHISISDSNCRGFHYAI